MRRGVLLAFPAVLPLLLAIAMALCAAAFANEAIMAEKKPNIVPAAPAVTAADGSPTPAPPSTPAPPVPAPAGDDDKQKKKDDDDQSKKKPEDDDAQKKKNGTDTDDDVMEKGGGFGAGSIFVAILFGMALMFGLLKMYVFWEKRRETDPPNYRMY